jgi:hypothetical protein
VRSARTDDGQPPWRPRGARCTTASRLSPSVWSGSQTGGGLPTPLLRLQTLRQRGVTATASLGPEGRVASRWGQRTAPVLSNETPHTAATVKRRLGGLRGAMTRHRAAAGTLAPALAHFLKVSCRYWSGRLHCDEGPELPRTNTDLEPCVGASRYHERRATGRKSASPALVLRGAVQRTAATATRLRVFAPWALAPEDIRTWQALRHALDTRRHQRPLRRRCRRNPEAYLAEREAALRK